MVRLNLCRIPEFLKDYKNVLDFESKQEQLTWMNTHIVTTIDCNAKMDNFTTSVVIPVPLDSTIRGTDYLFCTSTDGVKRLFFFIDGVEWVNSSSCRLHLTLDVWQTYHLSLDLKRSYVVRQHVPRWTDDNQPTYEIEAEPVNLGTYVLSGTPQPMYKTDNGAYIYTSSAPIGLVTKDSGSGTGGELPNPPSGGECGDVSKGIPTPSGFLFIKGYEGLAQYGHNIGDGVMTIGYGCTDAYDGDNYATLKANEPVSEELASEIMAQSLVSNYGIPLKKSLASDGINVNAHEFDAILSFVYNAGLGSWNRSAIRTALLNGDKAQAYQAWLTQNIMAGTQFEAGLRARRQAEANIFKSAEYELRTIVIYGQGGSVVGSFSASNSHVPALITGACHGTSGTITEYDCIDGLGNKWLFPVGGRISSTYPNYPDGSYHGAIDIAGNNLEPIYPPENGFVVYRSGWNTGGYGNLCILYHQPTDTYHYFAHQSQEPLVSEGQRVGISDCIGYVGTTGNSTGPHLHWEIRKGDLKTKVNPCANPSLYVGKTISRGQGGIK